MSGFFRWASISLYCLLGLFLIWFGWLYATVEEPLWFHAAAVPEAAREAVRPLYFALMNLIGGSSLSLGALSIYVTLTALRERRRGAGLAVLIALIIPFVMAAFTAEELAATTGAPTSWRLMGILIAVALAAQLFHFLAGRKSNALNKIG